jgi:hypothetical protein
MDPMVLSHENHRVFGESQSWLASTTDPSRRKKDPPGRQGLQSGSAATCGESNKPFPEFCVHKNIFINE